MKLFFVILFISLNTWAQFTLKGDVFEKGRKVRLSEINVYVLPEQAQAVTNKSGDFVFTDLKNENVELVIQAAGFEKYTQNLNLSETKNLRIYLSKVQDLNSFSIDVIDTNRKSDPSKKSLSRKQVFEMPGANGDPVKAVQNLPGINRAQGFSSQVIIQGSAPKDTAYDFEGHEIPLVFHFGGLNSVVMPEAIDTVDYFSAGYQADRSRALGGIISLKTRSPEVQERDSKGLFYVDNLSAGGLYESKINDHSGYLISGRYSYVGFFLKNAFKDNDALDLTVAPEFMDITGLYVNQIDESSRIKVSLLGSKDRLGFVFEEPVRSNPSVRGNFSNEILFFRFIPQYFKKIDDQNSYNISLGMGIDQINLDIGDRYFDLEAKQLTTRGQWDHQWDAKNLIQVGWDNTYSRSDLKVKLPLRREQGGVDNPISSDADRFADIKDSRLNSLGLYLKLDHDLTEKLKLSPALRADQFSVTKESFLLPRFSAQYLLDEKRLFKFSYGQYVQAPEPQESSEDFGNPDIKSPRADHYLISFEHDLKHNNSEGWFYSLGGFYRKFDQLIINSSNTIVRNGQSVFEVYNNKGVGKAYGLESMVKYFDGPWATNLSYTLSKSVRSDSNTDEYNFEYDQTHNLNLISSYEFKNNWKFSGRYRYVTGNPNTPVTGAIYDNDNEVYFPIRGGLYSERNKPFQQLDLRIDKKFILDTEIWSFYLDIQNVLNLKNPEGYQYSYDYKQRLEIMGLPILPALGVRGEF